MSPVHFKAFVTTALHPIRTIKSKERAGRVAQVIEHLPSKYETLNSKPQYHQK
jgi:hypothetical protein